MEKFDVYPYRRVNKNKKTSKKSMRIKFPPFKLSARRISLDLMSFETLSLMVIAFFGGRAVLLGELAPFGFAFTAGIITVFPQYGLLLVLSAVAGYFTILIGAQLVASIVVLFIVYMLMLKYHQRFRQVWYGTPALVMGVMLVVKVGVAAYLKADLYSYLTITFEAVLASGLSYVFAKAAPLMKRKVIKSFSWEERLFVILTLIGLLAGLSELEIGIVNLQRAFACFIVLLSIFTGGAGWGTAAGALVGVVPSLSTQMTPGLLGFFPFLGLIGGAFRNFGRIGISLGFLTGNILLSLYFNGSNTIISSLSEGMVGVILFMIIPTKIMHRTRSMVRIGLSERDMNIKDQRNIDYSIRKIRDFARVFNEVAKTFNQVSCEVQDSKQEKDLQQLFNGITSKVCSGCSLYRVCWETDFYKTYKIFMDLLSRMEISNYIKEESFAHDLRKRCIRIKEMTTTINCLYETYKTNNYWRKKMVESREVLSGQLKGVSSILTNLANEFKMDIQMRDDIEAILKTELAKSGHSILDLTVITSGDEHLEVNISCPSCGGKMQCARVINPIVSKILGQRMTVLNNSYCSKKTGDSVCEFKLHPARNFKIKVGHARAAKDGSMVSGDNISVTELKDGKVGLILSDGMGVGAKAALESNATIELLEQLLNTGFDKNLAVKTVNSILVLRSPEETFSTVDLAIIDQYSGVAEFIKIGAVPSFIKRPDRTEVVKYSSLPIGILNNIEVDCIESRMNRGDVLVMVSDGILDSHKSSAYKEEWVVNLLSSIKTTDPQNIADLILNRAIQNAGGIVDDDMTVLVAEVTIGNFH